MFLSKSPIVRSGVACSVGRRHAEPLRAGIDQLASVGLDGEADDDEVLVPLGVGLADGGVDQLLADGTVLRAEDDRDGLDRRR